MTKPIEIPGFRAYDYADAPEPCEMDKRLMIRDTLSSGPMPAECHLVTHGDSMMLIVENKRTGQKSIYDLKVRAHYVQDMSEGWVDDSYGKIVNG